jgi:hypothetical protein
MRGLEWDLRLAGRLRRFQAGPGVIDLSVHLVGLVVTCLGRPITQRRSHVPFARDRIPQKRSVTPVA